MIKIQSINAKQINEKKQEFLFNSTNNDEQEKVEMVVREILRNIRQNGDEALFKYINEFDSKEVCLKNIKVSQQEIDEAYSRIDREFIKLIQRAKARIVAFHEKQKQQSWFDIQNKGEYLGQIVRPINSVGVYVPGGLANYPSSVLMNVVPAIVAGVPKIVITTPANKNGKISDATLVAANEAGVSEIYKIGGAQAIAALAFGTKTVPKVDKIVGPGNIYVAVAKRNVFGFVDIDSFAGPSEITIIADETAKAKFVCADLLSQAEHDEQARCVLITTSVELAKDVLEEFEIQVPKLEKKAIIEKALKNFGQIIVVESIEAAIELSNSIAPEHLEICTSAPFDCVSQIQNAGSIFLGNYSPEPLGDYMAGPNHVIPTGGSARFFSPLCVQDFTKKSSIISFTKQALENLSDDVIEFATIEGLTAHANAVRVRRSGEVK